MIKNHDENVGDDAPRPRNDPSNALPLPFSRRETSAFAAEEVPEEEPRVPSPEEGSPFETAAKKRASTTNSNQTTTTATRNSGNIGESLKPEMMRVRRASRRDPRNEMDPTEVTRVPRSSGMTASHSTSKRIPRGKERRQRHQNNQQSTATNSRPLSHFPKRQQKAKKDDKRGSKSNTSQVTTREIQNEPFRAEIVQQEGDEPLEFSSSMQRHLVGDEYSNELSLNTPRFSSTVRHYSVEGDDDSEEGEIHPGVEWVGGMHDEEQSTLQADSHLYPVAHDEMGVANFLDIRATVVDENDIVEATRMEDTTGERKRLRSYLIIVLLLLVLVVVVAVAVVLTQTRGSERTLVVNTTTSPTSLSSLVPSLSVSPSYWPTSTPSSLPSSNLQSLLVSNSLDGGAALAEAGSPQQQAFLSIQDELILEPELSAERILQRYALETLYFATSGTSWTQRWNIEPLDTSIFGGRFVSHECSWLMVTCNKTFVVVVNLTDNNLFGTLPDELLILTQLSHLHLSRNTLQQSIPVGLQRMSNLVSLDLSDNLIDAGFSFEMRFMTSLEHVNLKGNFLAASRTLPTEIGLLTDLRTIQFEGNQLSGRIVSEIGELTQLVSLSLSSSMLTGPIPSELGRLTQLTLLKVHDNQLTGMIPTELGWLVQLIELTLQDNQLSGLIPSELALLTNLATLTLNSAVPGNNFTGTISQQICNTFGATGVLDLGCYGDRVLIVCQCRGSPCYFPACE